MVVSLELGYMVVSLELGYMVVSLELGYMVLLPSLTLVALNPQLHGCMASSKRLSSGKSCTWLPTHINDCTWHLSHERNADA
jgi:hypothetical protein